MFIIRLNIIVKVPGRQTFVTEINFAVYFIFILFFLIYVLSAKLNYILTGFKSNCLNFPLFFIYILEKQIQPIPETSKHFTIFILLYHDFCMSWLLLLWVFFFWILNFENHKLKNLTLQLLIFNIEQYGVILSYFIFLSYCITKIHDGSVKRAWGRHQRCCSRSLGAWLGNGPAQETQVPAEWQRAILQKKIKKS